MPPKTAKDNRPRIWAEGQQSPPFAPRAFALASVLFARDSLSGLLRRCALSAVDFGQLVATGRWRVPPHRLGRTGRFLPSVETTARAIAAGSTVLTRAASSVADEPVAAPASIFTEPAPKPRAPVTPASQPPTQQTVTRSLPSAPPDDPDLAAIRAMLADVASSPPAPRRPTPPTPTAQSPVLPDLETNWRREWLADAAGKVLGYGLLLVSLPVGAVRAAFAHLNGEDLRKLVAER